MTPTPLTDAKHERWCMENADTRYMHMHMRWHAESLERETQTLRSEIGMLKSRILKLEPEKL